MTELFAGESCQRPREPLAPFNRLVALPLSERRANISLLCTLFWHYASGLHLPTAPTAVCHLVRHRVLRSAHLQLYRIVIVDDYQ